MILAFICTAASLTAQDDAERRSAVEKLAVKTAIARAVGVTRPSLRIAIDPMIVAANEAPGARDSVRRETQRSTSLSLEFGAVTRERGVAIDCSTKPCRLKDADVFVTLSEPMFRGLRATVTVTTVQNTRRGIQYRTVNVICEQRRGRWEVVAIEELGIS